MSLIDDYRNTTQLKLDYLIQETTKKPSPFKSDSLFVEGHDITEMLGIKKYDPEAAQERQIVERKFPWWKKLLSRIPFFRTFFYKKTRESFPTFVVPKTDETRVQVLQKALDANVGLMCFATEKLDGQSGTWFWYKKQFYVCSRNFRVVNKNTSYWRIAGKYDLEKLLKETNIAIQGEIIGPGIQGNKYGLREIDMYVFNVWDIKTRKTAKTTEWIATEISLKPVPVIGDVFLSRDSNIFPLTNDIRALVEMAKGKSALADIPREGIVIRSLDGKPYNVISNIFSFKVINPEFLLRYGDEQ